LVVLGKYVPQLEFIGILMGDEAVLEPYMNYYQRLVAQDQDDAIEIVEEYLQSHTLAQVYDDSWIPALSAAKKDRKRNNLSQEEDRFIVQATREIVEDLGLRSLPPVDPEAEAVASLEAGDEVPPPPKIRLVTCPVRDEAGEVALLMLKQLLDPALYEIEQLPDTLLASEVLTLVEQQHVGLICLGALASGRVVQTRYFCKRLRARLPELKIVVGHWGAPKRDEAHQKLVSATGADEAGTTLQETRTQVMQMGQRLPALEPLALPAVAAGSEGQSLDV
jgi:hypothetical protein